MKSQATFTSRNLLGQYYYNLKFSSHPILENAASVYFILKNVSQKSKRYKKFLDDKLVEIALKKGMDGLDLDMDLHARIKQEMNRIKSENKEDPTPLKFIKEGLFDSDESEDYGEDLEEEQEEEKRQT